MNNHLREFRAKLQALQLLSRQMIGRIDELSYYTDFFDLQNDADAKAAVDYLYGYLKTDYERLRFIGQETILPEKEQVNGEADSKDST